VAFRLTSHVEAERNAQIQDARMQRILLRSGVCWTAIDHGHTFDKTLGRHGKPIGLIEAQKRKARGVRAGIPDFLYWHQGRGYAIERKVAGGVISDEQKQFQAELVEAGIPVAVCWTQKEICDALEGWGLLRQYKAIA
jgi:hypothetical protein